VRLRPLLLTCSAFLAAVHVFGVLAGTPALPWAAVAAFGLLLAYAGVEDRNYPLLAALAALTVHAVATIPRKVEVSQYYLEVVEPGVIDGVTGRTLREAAFLLLVVTLLLFASLAGAPPARGVLLAGGGVMVLLAGYAAVRIADVMSRFAAFSRTGRELWSTGADLSVLSGVPLAAALVAVFIAVVAARRPWVVAGAVLLALGAALRMDDVLQSVPLPYGAAIHDPFAAWDELTVSATLPGLRKSLRAGLELAGIILVVAGLSHRAAGGRVREG